jgi:hypothetical protein
VPLSSAQLTARLLLKNVDPALVLTAGNPMRIFPRPGGGQLQQTSLSDSDLSDHCRFD